MTTINFCGTAHTLETLKNYEFIQLYDEVVSHACDLMERSRTMPLRVYSQYQASCDRAIADTASLMVLLDIEDTRRKALPTGPALCLMCEGLHDPGDLCDECQEAYNDFEGSRYVEMAA